MARTKDELQREARELGLTDFEDLNRDDLQRHVDEARQGTAALGPVVPEGQEPVQPEAVGNTSTGVQPMEEGDIPEAGR